MRVRPEMFNFGKVSFYSVPNEWIKLTTCCSSNVWWKLQDWFFHEKGGLLIVGCKIRCPKKYQAEEMFTLANFMKNWMSSYFRLISRGSKTSTNVMVWATTLTNVKYMKRSHKTPEVFTKTQCLWIFRNRWFPGGGKSALLFIVKIPYKNWSKSPRQIVWLNCSESSREKFDGIFIKCFRTEDNWGCFDATFLKVRFQEN